MPAPHRLTPLGKALLLRHALRPSLSMSALGLALALPYATVAQAQDLAFDIPAQPLSSALLSFGKQTDLQILFSQDTVQGRRSAAVAGRLSPEQALARLLQGTGVSYSVQGNVVTLGAPRAADDAAMQLGATNISGAALGITTEGTG
ncbi:STN domain-containing protein, partial [Pseudomonas shirazensis]